MGRRLDFQTFLESLVPSAHVYFQPPENINMIYPAIVYNRDYQSVDYADDIPFRREIRWQLTVIDRDPDSTIPDMIAELPMTRFIRHYTADQLNHDIYDTYF